MNVVGYLAQGSREHMSCHRRRLVSIISVEKIATVLDFLSKNNFVTRVKLAVISYCQMASIRSSYDVCLCWSQSGKYGHICMYFTWKRAPAWHVNQSEWKLSSFHTFVWVWPSFEHVQVITNRECHKVVQKTCSYDYKCRMQCIIVVSRAVYSSYTVAIGNQLSTGVLGPITMVLEYLLLLLTVNLAETVTVPGK